MLNPDKNRENHAEKHTTPSLATRNHGVNLLQSTLPLDHVTRKNSRKFTEPAHELMTSFASSFE